MNSWSWVEADSFKLVPSHIEPQPLPPLPLLLVEVAGEEEELVAELLALGVRLDRLAGHVDHVRALLLPLKKDAKLKRRKGEKMWKTSLTSDIATISELLLNLFPFFLTSSLKLGSEDKSWYINNN